MDKQINKICYIRTKDLYAAWNRKEALLHAIAWMDLEDIMLSDISPSQKDKYCITPPI